MARLLKLIYKPNGGLLHQGISGELRRDRREREERGDKIEERGERTREEKRERREVLRFVYFTNVVRAD